jgi:hypothetical protein
MNYFERYRFRRHTTEFIANGICHLLTSPTRRNKPILPIVQILLFLPFVAMRSHNGHINVLKTAMVIQFINFICRWCLFWYLKNKLTPTLKMFFPMTVMWPPGFGYVGKICHHGQNIIQIIAFTPSWEWQYNCLGQFFWIGRVSR